MRSRIVLLFLIIPYLANAAGSSGELKLTPAELDARLHEAGDDPLQLLPLVRFTGEDKGKEIRHKVQKLLAEHANQLTVAELNQLARKLAKLLPTVLHTPDEVAEVLGPGKKISRQILHRSYQEQWQYEKPIPVIVTFHHPKGQAPQLLSATAWKVTVP